MKSKIIPLEQLKHGYNISIDHGIRCLGASMVLVKEYPDKALSLAQIGQEEIGKSLTLLASAALPSDPGAWKWFWKGWRDHRLKAHRAYLYEIFHPLRIELLRPDGSLYAGEPLKENIVQEKEMGLYVDYDNEKADFISPAKQVDEIVALCRISTLLYLGSTADAIRRALLSTNEDFRICEFGKMALSICSELIFQQQWITLKSEFAAKSERHAALISDLDISLKNMSNFFHDLPIKKHD